MFFLIIYVLGVIGSWALGAMLWGAASADPEFSNDTNAHSNYVEGVLIISIIWPFVLVFLFIIWIFSWLTDLGKSWAQK